MDVKRFSRLLMALWLRVNHKHIFFLLFHSFGSAVATVTTYTETDQFNQRNAKRCKFFLFLIQFVIRDITMPVSIVFVICCYMFYLKTFWFRLRSSEIWINRLHLTLNWIACQNLEISCVPEIPFLHNLNVCTHFHCGKGYANQRAEKKLDPLNIERVNIELSQHVHRARVCEINLESS